MSTNKTGIRLRKGSRLLCPQCRTVQTLEFQNEKDEAFLICGHHRTPRLLNPAPGHLSLEAVIAGDPLALSLFPATDVNGQRIGHRDIADVLSDLTMQQKRDAWGMAA